VEQHLKALRPAEQGGRVRDLLRSPRIAVILGTSCRCSTRPSFAPMSRRQAPKGAGRSGARLFPRRLLDQDPPEDRLRQPSHRVRPDGRREERRVIFPDPARARPRQRPACRCRRQGLRQQGQPAGGALTRHRPGHPAQDEREGQASLLRQSPLSGGARIEQAVGKFKRFKRVALRCEKTKQNSAAIVALAAAFVLVKSVHTT
jgi:hypothetical protein